MIKVEGFRAFHGTMRINYGKNSTIAPEEITADWLYKPEYKCWYGQGRSFPAEICEVVRDDAKELESYRTAWEYVYCLDCKNYTQDGNGKESCPYDTECDLWNSEDGRHRFDRPHFTPKGGAPMDDKVKEEDDGK